MTSNAGLIDGPLAGGEDASTRPGEFTEFVRQRASLPHERAYLLRGDWHLAHDVVQETLVRAYRNWPRIQQAASPEAYVEILR